MAAEFGRSKAQLGLIESAGHVAYGVGKFANGVLADGTNPRYFMALGLLLTAQTNVAFGLNSSLVALVLLWGLNGWFQSMGFPPGARLLSHGFSPSEHGWICGVYGCSHPVGTAITSIAAGYMVFFGWRYTFFAPAAVAVLLSVLLYYRLRAGPNTSNGVGRFRLFRSSETPKTSITYLEKSENGCPACDARPQLCTGTARLRVAPVPVQYRRSRR